MRCLWGATLFAASFVLVLLGEACSSDVPAASPTTSDDGGDAADLSDTGSGPTSDAATPDGDASDAAAACDGCPTIVLQGQNIDELLIDGTHIYWIDATSKTIKSTPKASIGSPITTLFGPSSAAPRNLRLGGAAGHLAWIAPGSEAGDSVYYRDGVSNTEVFGASSSIASIALGDATVYAATSTAVVSCSLPSCASPTEICAVPNVPALGHGDRLYFVDGAGSIHYLFATDSGVTCPIFGSSVVSPTEAKLHTQGDAVVWSSAPNNVVRVTLPSAGPTVASLADYSVEKLAFASSPVATNNLVLLFAGHDDADGGGPVVGGIVFQIPYTQVQAAVFANMDARAIAYDPSPRSTANGLVNDAYWSSGTNLVRR